jgi:ankyrin repeat protein
VAAGHGRLEVARLLLDGGADPSIAASNDNTPLMAAVANGQLEVLRLLLGRGAITTVDAASSVTGGLTAMTSFHFACFHNRPNCAEALVRAGCDVGLKTLDGFTGQQLAEAQGSKEVVQRLRYLAYQPFVGVLVELAGLVGAAEYNGKRATVRATARRSRGHIMYVPHD